VELDFGFAGLSFDRDPVYTFTNPGNYIIMLEVSKAGRSDLILREGYINVTFPFGSPPVANFTANVTAGNAPFTVQFNDTYEGDPTSWSCSFGDGILSTLKNPEHTYTTSGTFFVSQTVTNAGGSDDTTKPGFITVFPKGDFNMNGRVDVGDVTRVAYMAVNLTPWDPAADFNGDTKVDIGDASKIAYYYVGRVAGL